MKKAGHVMRGILDVLLLILSVVVFMVAFIVTLPVIIIGWVVIVPLSAITCKLDKGYDSLCTTIIKSTGAYLSGIIKGLENIVSKIES